jgi:hypothetical protein
VYPNETNTEGCPLSNQHGSQAVLHYDRIIAGLSPVQRALFEQERLARQAELDAIAHGDA